MPATAPSSLTLPNLKAFFRDPETQRLIKVVKAGRKHAVATRAKVDAYIAPVFAACGPFPIADRFAEHRGAGMVSKPSLLYLCEDEAKIEAFYDACDKAHVANGYDLPAGHCPALVAEHAVTAAENALLKHVAKAFPEFASGSPICGSIRKRLLDLFLAPPKD